MHAGPMPSFINPDHLHHPQHLLSRPQLINMSPSTDKTIALVTGANQGIGKCVATALATKHNYHVIIGSRGDAAGAELAASLRSSGHSASHVQLDLTSRPSVEAAVKAIEADFGRLDVLVNNAGVLFDFNQMDPWELFERTFQTNVIGTAMLTESLLPLLRKATQGPPRVVFVSSKMGTFAESLDKSSRWYPIDIKAYDSSKAAVNLLMINYARILSDVGGKVNSACPGLVNTRLSGSPDDGDTPEVGATRIVELATLDSNGPTATFSNRLGDIDW